jgi:hypothetical protein
MLRKSENVEEEKKMLIKGKMLRKRKNIEEEQKS